jgi:glutamate-1-semialdehyde aminotransferase
MFNEKIYYRSLESIAQGALTNSKRAESFIFKVYPTHLIKGEGCHVWDNNNNKYIDYICGLGTNLIGYGNEKIADMIYNHYRSGSCLSLSSFLEIEYAEKIKGLFPAIERLKILKTGSEACHASLKIARTYTGKSLVLSEGYHGWHEEFNSLIPPAMGCPNSFNIEKFTDISQLENRHVGAFILEPINTDFTDKRIEFLKKITDICKKNKIVLIFDETITGCRFPKLSVAKYLGLDPDLIILGKAIGGGLPLSIVGGKKEIMESGEYFVSSTFAGDRVAMAASFCFLSELIKLGIDGLWSRGEYFQEKFNSLHPSLKIEGYPTRGAFKGHEVIKALFFQEAIKAKILFGPSWFYNFHHKDHDDLVLNTIKDIFNMISSGNVKLNGHFPKSPFAQRVRE